MQGLPVDVLVHDISPFMSECGPDFRRHPLLSGVDHVDFGSVPCAKLWGSNGLMKRVKDSPLIDVATIMWDLGMDPTLEHDERLPNLNENMISLWTETPPPWYHGGGLTNVGCGLLRAVATVPPPPPRCTALATNSSRRGTLNISVQPLCNAP